MGGLMLTVATVKQCRLRDHLDGTWSDPVRLAGPRFRNRGSTSTTFLVFNLLGNLWLVYG